MPFCFAFRKFSHPRTRRTVVLLLALWGLGLCDYLFTLWAQRFTPFQEVNPWASSLLSGHQFTALALGKASLTAFATFIFWRLRKRTSTQFALWGLFVLHAGLMVRWSTYTSTALAMGDVGDEGPRFVSALPAVTAQELEAARVDVERARKLSFAGPRNGALAHGGPEQPPGRLAALSFRPQD